MCEDDELCCLSQKGKSPGNEVGSRRETGACRTFKISGFARSRVLLSKGPKRQLLRYFRVFAPKKNMTGARRCVFSFEVVLL